MMRQSLIFLMGVSLVTMYAFIGAAQPLPPGNPSDNRPNPAKGPIPRAEGKSEGPVDVDFPPGDPQYGERETLIRQGANGIVTSLMLIAKGALLTDDFEGKTIDFERWRLAPFITIEWVSLKDGALRIAGHIQRPQKNILNILSANTPGAGLFLGVVSRRFPTADVVAVMRMKPESLPKPQSGGWGSVLHVCSACPDYFSEIRFGTLPGGGFGWNLSSKDEHPTSTDPIPAFGDEATRFYTVKVERDGPSRVMTAYVERPDGWVKIGEAVDTHLFAARLELKMAADADGIDVDMLYDDIRLYLQPNRNPVRFVITKSFPGFDYPASGSESLALKLYQADGTTLIGEGRRAVDDAFEVPLSRNLTFPISAVIKLYREGKEVGSGRIEAKGVEGLYPGDVWGVNL